MLIDWTFNNKKLLVSYINSEGKYKFKHYDMPKPKKRIIDYRATFDESLPHTWDGYPTKLIDSKYPDKYYVYDFLDNLPKDERDEILNYKKDPSIYFIDIETRSDDGFPDPQKAESEITLISLVSKRKVALLGTKNLNETQKEWIIKQTKSHLSDFSDMEKLNFVYEEFETEFSMLKYFFEFLMPSINVVSGWNVSAFDWPYLFNRANRLKDQQGKKIDVSKASITGEYGHGPRGFTAKVPRHKLIIDYMNLYEKWDTSVKVKESSALNWVSNKLLKVKKVNYAGTLDQLYVENFPLYAFYNVIDSMLVQLIHEKQRYINIMFATAHLASVRIVDSLSAIAVTEGYLRKPLYEMNKIVFVKNGFDNNENGIEDVEEESIEGGYVKDPNPGICPWVSVMDFNSLYPTTQRVFFIVPENYRGILIEEDGKKMVLNPKNNKKSDLKADDVVLVNKRVFSKKPSPTKNKLTEIFNDRKKFKKMKEEKQEELKKVKNKIKELEKKLNAS